ncbi:hypothetical protein BJ741DRAFT_582472 [Chytriomyces cf. hyalinus JEL632]|nr:hypothetical protein BJ741DRAFT_582472 [Chytriomyces cf. hyalinus JEL632]
MAVKVLSDPRRSKPSIAPGQPVPVCTVLASSAQQHTGYTNSDTAYARRFSVASSTSVPACIRLSSPSDDEDSFVPNNMVAPRPCIPIPYNAPAKSNRSQNLQNSTSFTSKKPGMCLTDDSSSSSDNDSISPPTHTLKHQPNASKQPQRTVSSQHQNTFLASIAPPKPGVCHFCQSCKTGQWRRGPGGMRTLCNACGINWCRKVRAFARVNGVSISEAEETVGADGAWFRRIVT